MSAQRWTTTKNGAIQQRILTSLAMIASMAVMLLHGKPREAIKPGAIAQLIAFRQQEEPRSTPQTYSIAKKVLKTGNLAGRRRKWNGAVKSMIGAALRRRTLLSTGRARLSLAPQKNAGKMRRQIQVHSRSPAMKCAAASMVGHRPRVNPLVVATTTPSTGSVILLLETMLAPCRLPRMDPMPQPHHSLILRRMRVETRCA